MNHTGPLPDLDWYLTRAMQVSRIPSYGKLSLCMGLARITVSAWRQGKAWPNEDHMAHLAKLGGVPVEQALIDLARWRAKGETARVWERLRAMLPATLAVPLFLIACAFSAMIPGASYAAERKPVGSYSVYYEIRKRRRFRFGLNPEVA